MPTNHCSRTASSNGEETRSKFMIDDHRIMPYETPASLGAALAWRLNANEIRVEDATDEVPQSSKDHQHHTRAAWAHKYLEYNPRLRANNNELILAHFEVADDDHRLIYHYGYDFRNGVIGKRFTARLWNNGVGPGRVYIAVDLYFASSTALNGQIPQKMHMFRRWLTVHELRHEFFKSMMPFCAADGAPSQRLYESIFANAAAGIEIYERPQPVEASHSEA